MESLHSIIPELFKMCVLKIHIIVLDHFGVIKLFTNETVVNTKLWSEQVSRTI